MQAGGPAASANLVEIRREVLSDSLPILGPKMDPILGPNRKEGWVLEIPTGPRMPPRHSIPRTGDGPGVVHAPGGPVPTATIEAAWVF